MLRLKSIKLLYIFVLVFAAIWIIAGSLWGLSICNESQLAKRAQELNSLERRLDRYSRKLIQREINHSSIVSSDPTYPWIFIITPTYARPVQKAELVRLAQTLLLVKNIHWIIVEDSAEKTTMVKKFLKQSGLHYTHLNIQTPEDYKLKSNDPNWLKPRGVLQRNLGLSWLRQSKHTKIKAVVYFADDDNTYDFRLFEQMRFTKKVSVWPVGLVGGLRFERPLVENGRVVGWYTFWKPKRPFAMDMAGFAINLELLLKHPDALFGLEVPRGYQETSLLSKLVSMHDLEPKAVNCSEILVWHTRTEKPKLSNEVRLQKLGRPVSDLTIEV